MDQNINKGFAVIIGGIVLVILIIVALPILLRLVFTILGIVAIVYFLKKIRE